MSHFLHFVVATFHVAASSGENVTTCGTLKDIYKRNQCCGNPSKVVDMVEQTRSAGASSGCVDLTGWSDKDGDSCSKVVNNGWCGRANQYKTSYGADNSRVGAKQACCGCGGGMRTASGKLMGCIDYADESAHRDMGITSNGHCLERTDTRGRQTPKNLKNKMMFFGDSDIEYWSSNDVFPASVNCGVGGSSVYEAQLHAEKTARRFTPKGYLVLVAGENDMSSSIECAETLFLHLQKTVRAFVDSRYHPTVIMFGTKPEPGTTNLHSLYRKYDALAKSWPENDASIAGHFKFIDVHQKFLDMGNPGTLYKNDELHMKQAGYDFWNQWLQSKMKEGCHDLLGADGSSSWADTDGDTCSKISSDNNCLFYADYVPAGGFGANAACCECGGGCDDRPGWVDSDGDDCTTVVSGNMCQQADGFKVDGIGAKQACCGCGGGTSRQPRL